MSTNGLEALLHSYTSLRYSNETLCSSNQSLLCLCDINIIRTTFGSNIRTSGYMILALSSFFLE